jgi:hypothetical protein
MKIRSLVFVIMLCTAATRAEDLSLREGLWYVHTVTTIKPGRKKTETTMRLCRNHSFDSYARSKSQHIAGFECSTAIDQSRRDHRIIDLKCQGSHAQVRVHKETDSIDEFHLRSETHSSFSPPFRGESERLILKDEDYVGSCPPELKPGDGELESGVVQHLWKR